jgi:hypothetical protein
MWWYLMVALVVVDVGWALPGRNPRHVNIFLFYYESRNRELQTRLIYEDRYDERLKN